MSDYSNSNWNEIDVQNTSPSPDGLPAGSSPSSLYGVIRAARGAAKRDFNRSNSVQTSTGSGAAYVLTYDVGPETHVKGEVFRFFAHTDNTGPATLKINDLTQKTVTQGNGNALSAGQIKAGTSYGVVYDGTSYRLITPVMNNPEFTGSVKANAFIGTSDLTYNGHKVWHAESDGAESGLDADLLDGYHAAELPVSAPVQTALNLKTDNTTFNILSDLVDDHTTAIASKLPLAGGSMTGHIKLHYGSADPSSLSNGHLWVRDTGAFARIAGATHKLLSDTGNQAITGNLTTTGTVVATGNVQTSAKFIGDGSSLSSLPLNGMGVGQTWRNYTTSREHGTTYTNSTSKPIMVNINTPGWNCDAQVRTSSSASWVAVANGHDGGTQCFIVPVGHQYRLTGEQSLNVWSELR